MKQQSSNQKVILGVLSFLSILILVAFIYSIMQVSDMRNPVIYLLVLLAVTGFSIWALRKVWNEISIEVKGKWLMLGGFVVLLWFVLVLGVASGVNSNRDSCISSEVLIHNNGYIPNPDKYLAFHTQCPGNTTLYDAETKAYIHEHNKLPSWIVIDDFTKDAVGWVNAHGIKDPAVLQEIANANGRIPERYLKPLSEE